MLNICYLSYKTFFNNINYLSFLCYVTEKSMSERSYTSILQRACKVLFLFLSHFLHLGRVTAPAQLELEEVDGKDSRALGNWKQDVFATCYSTQLPLPAMRVMAGHDKRQGFHVNPRTTFFGDDSHQELPKLIFPWLEREINKVNQVKNKTAAAFLSFLDSLRWVILQDAAVLISEGRDHYIYKTNPHIFMSPTFLDYETKLLAHIERHKCDQRFNAILDSVLPGVHERLDNQNFALNHQSGKLEIMSSRIHGVMKNYEDFRTMYLEEKKEQEDKITSVIKAGMCDVKDSIGNMMESHVKGLCQHIGNYDLGQHISPPLLTANESVNYNIAGAIENSENSLQIQMSQQLVPNDLSRTNGVLVEEPYKIPKFFTSFKSMMTHWYNVVRNRNDNEDKSWRKHLSAAEKKRFQRLARVFKAFKKMLTEGITMSSAESTFEDYFQSNKKSLALLSDKFSKSILDKK